MKVKSIVVVIMVCFCVMLSLTSCKVGHQHTYIYGYVIYDATFSNEGLRKLICECGDEITQPVPALGEEGVSDLLNGTSWVSGSSSNSSYKVNIEFLNRGFKVVVNGITLISGSYKVSEEKITCIDSETGDVSAMYGYYIESGKITLTLLDNGKPLVRE